jgi:cobalt/nickel transport system permease protein
MYRYLPVITGEAQRMQRARASRTFSQRRFLAWNTLGTVIAQLFVRCITRGERIYLAMCARGWK